MEKDTKQNEFININYGFQHNGAYCPELTKAEELVRKYLIPDAGREIMQILRRTQDGIAELGQYTQSLEGGLLALERFRPEEYDTREGLKLKLEVMANIVKRTLNREPEFVTAPGSYEEAISKLGLAYANNAELTEKLTERNLTLSDKLEELAEVKERVASLLEEQSESYKAVAELNAAILEEMQARAKDRQQIELLKNDRYALGVVLETTEYLAEETLQASYASGLGYTAKPEVDKLREVIRRIGTNAKEAVELYLRRSSKPTNLYLEHIVTIPLLIGIFEKIDERACNKLDMLYRKVIPNFKHYTQETQAYFTSLQAGLEVIQNLARNAIKGKENYNRGAAENWKAEGGSVPEAKYQEEINTYCSDCSRHLVITSVKCDYCSRQAPGKFQAQSLPETVLTIPLLISILERIEGRTKAALSDYSQWKREEELPLHISNLLTYLASVLRDVKKITGEALKDNKETYSVGVDTGKPGGDKTVFSVQQTPQAVRCNEDDIKPTYNPPIFFSGSCDNLEELGDALIKGMRQAKARNTCGGCGATPGNPHYGGCPSLR